MQITNADNALFLCCVRHGSFHFIGRMKVHTLGAEQYKHVLKAHQISEYSSLERLMEKCHNKAQIQVSSWQVSSMYVANTRPVNGSLCHLHEFWILFPLCSSSCSSEYAQKRPGTNHSGSAIILSGQEGM